MNAMVVDDERLACTQLKRMLERTGAFQTIKVYDDPETARADAEKEPVDVAFLDIEMPEISGIDLAEAIQAGNEAVQVVFITAYDEFAIKAFEINAVDYLLKPVTVSRLNKTVDRLLGQAKAGIHSEKEAADKRQLGIECFGSLKFYRRTEGVKTYIPVKWRTSKARELYAFFLSEHDRFISKERLTGLLWPDADPAKAQTQLYTTIYQIRKLMNQLPFHHRIVKNDIGYSLVLSGTPIDAEEWEKALNGLEPISAASYEAHIRLFKMYSDHYFGEYGYIWAEPERVRLSRLWMAHACRLIDFLIREKNYVEALDICQQADKIEPDSEKIMKYQISIYNKTGNVEDVIHVYERYKKSKNAMN
ncbi:MULTISPECIES: response regulator [unclassified Sporolactobacillus]|uniref:response regulator n=1 Tax=unclassified Sporolactobacillus TaxID=2628533 RepID=UPI002367B862|nr:response regulator [Sporolactobacillus sp. CQH2019]MDD9148380.1 response regulator [Sporolactobacillus sp. CQH2019]